MSLNNSAGARYIVSSMSKSVAAVAEDRLLLASRTEALLRSGKKEKKKVSLMSVSSSFATPDTTFGAAHRMDDFEDESLESDAQVLHLNFAFFGKCRKENARLLEK